jgi:hypothetical protein
MTPISSKMTFFYKRVFPVIWLGGLLLVFVFDALFFSGLISGDFQGSIILFLIGPPFLAVFGYLMTKKVFFGLVDEVLDAGDAVIVRNAGQEERISLSDIKNISYRPNVRPPQVTLSLRRQTVFGDTIAFLVPDSGKAISFRTSPVIDDLINRTDSARRKR